MNWLRSSCNYPQTKMLYKYMNVEKSKIIPIKLHNRYVSDILNEPPHWFVRIGGFLMLFLVVLIIGICMLIKYTDTISGSVSYNAETDCYQMSVPYSRLSNSVADGAVIRIEVDNRPYQKYGYKYAVLVSKFYDAKTQSYSLVFKPKRSKREVKSDAPLTSGSGVIFVGERNLMQRLYETLTYKVVRN